MNINDYIYFKPTAAGENVLLNHPYLSDSERMPNQLGYHKIQFWEFCNIFGEHFNIGSKQFFVDNEVVFEMPKAIDANESA